MIKFANKTANIKYKKRLTSSHYCVRRPSDTSKSAEIILLGHRVRRSITLCPSKMISAVLDVWLGRTYSVV